MGKSRNIIQALSENLRIYLADPLVIIERYRVPANELEARQDIKKARIALYELDERVTVQVDAARANLSDQRYGIDLTYVRGYAKNDASRGELPLVDLRDRVLDWAQQVDAGGLTDSAIFTFGYQGAGGITRGDRMVTMTMTFVSLRDLSITQSTIV